MTTRILRAMVLVVTLLAPVRAAEPAERTILQYTHQRWTDEIDAPRPVVAVAEDQKGFLWVASAPGLFRFDGIRFVPVSSHIDLVRHGTPSVILVRRNGDVWTNFERSRRFAVYRNGWLRFVQAPAAPHRVSAMQEAADGTIWVLTEQVGTPLMRFRRGKWTTFGVEAGAPIDNPFSMVVTRDGAVWVSFTGSVARLQPNAKRFQTVRKMPRSLGRLSLDPDGRVWITERKGSYPITGPNGEGQPPKLRYAYATDRAEIRGWPRFDREGNLWIATYYDGLQRVARPDPRGAASRAQAVATVERFTERDGLSSNVTAQVFQDGEGNVWASTEGGLDRFRPATIRFEAVLIDPAAFGDLLLRASDGSVYIGQASTVYRVRPGGSPEPIYKTKVEPRTLCEAPDGAIWIGVDKDIFIWRGGRVLQRLRKVPLEFTIYDCAFDANGDYWVTAARGGMARYSRGRWARMFGPTGPSFMPKSMVPDPLGRLFLHWSDRAVARLDQRGRSFFSIPFGDYGPNDVTLYADSSDSLYVAGRFGLARLHLGGVQSLSARRFPQLSGVNGIVQTPAGETWFAAPGGLLRTRTRDLGAAFTDPGKPLPLTVFGNADGLRSPPHSHSRQAIVRGGDGRVWIATQSGTQWFNPADIQRGRAAPRTAITAVMADQFYSDPERVRLPAGTSKLSIAFAAFNFSNPRGAQVRYRMEGHDADWLNAQPQRTAFYTNLKPGTYRFRVIAANEDGVWNERGSSIEIVIPPTFVQSWPFFILCIAAGILVLWLLYRIRIARISTQIRRAMEERVGERERIARELHDTLLQGIQGLVLRFQSVANKMPPEGSLKAQLETALNRADEVIAEGRNRVQDLRLVPSSSDLPEVLQARALEVDFDPKLSIRIVVEGRPRPVHPLVSAEIGHITAEALFNIAHHANASAAEITVRYGARELMVEISDNGIGIGPDVLAMGGKDGHYGLIGMRERADRIGGVVEVEGELGTGTVVSIRLSARHAFVDEALATRFSATLLRLRDKLFRASKAAGPRATSPRRTPTGQA